MADARLWGLPDDQVEQLRAVLAGPRAQSESDGVWLCNVPIVNAFLAVCTQWRTGFTVRDGVPATLFVGLDYAACAALFAATGRTLSADEWAGLRLVELGARSALNGTA